MRAFCISIIILAGLYHMSVPHLVAAEFLLTARNTSAGSETIDGVLAEEIRAELSTDLTEIPKIWDLSDARNAGVVTSIIEKNMNMLAREGNIKSGIEHFLIDKELLSPDKREAIVRLISVTTPSLEECASGSEPLGIGATQVFSRYYYLVKNNEEWKLSISDPSALLSLLIANDACSNRLFFFENGAAENLPEGKEAEELADTDVIAPINRFKRFLAGGLWNSFRLYCDPIAVATTSLFDKGSAENAVASYMKAEKNGDIESIENILAPSDRGAFLKEVNEMGEDEARQYMREMFSGYGDSFSIFGKGTVKNSDDGRQFVFICGVGVLEEWQVSSFCMLPANGGTFQVSETLPDDIRSQTDEEFGRIVPLWSGEMLFKRYTRHLPEM